MHPNNLNKCQQVEKECEHEKEFCFKMRVKNQKLIVDIYNENVKLIYTTCTIHVQIKTIL